MELRPYQREAITAVRREYEAGTRRQALVLATGCGKTVIFAQIPRVMKDVLPGQTLIIAHTEELIHQNAETLQALNPDLTVGIEMAGSYADPNSDIIVASVQTLGRSGTKRVDRFDWSRIDKVVVDEAHHSTTDAYRRILDRAGVLLPETSKLLLGVTATSNRTDGVALSDIYNKVVSIYPLRQAIEEGWLVDIRGYRVHTTISLDGVAKTSNDYAARELSERVNTPLRNEQIVDAWKRVGETRKTVVYCVDIQHAKDMAEEFRGAGVAAEAVWGDDPDRGERLARHRQGTTNVLCVCQLLLEGYDDPTIACVVVAKPSQSVIFLPQAVGRGTRLEDGVNMKEHDPFERVKRNLIVIDVVDGKAGTSLITLPTLMGLSNNLDTEGRSIVEAARTIEEAQEQHPGVDFTKLESLSGVKTLTESVDMFQVRFPEEVKENSELTWFRAACGKGYKMLIPKETEGRGLVHIYENTLGQWELNGKINGDEFHGVRPTFEEAIKVTDEQIRKRVTKQTLSYIAREAQWHGKKVSRGQQKMLERLFPHRKFNYEQMNSGQASKFIAETLMRRGK